MDNLNYIINVDYLQVYCDLSNYTPSEPYEFREESYGTKNFEILETVTLQESIFCTLQRKPRSSILEEHCGIIKFDNSLLYSTQAYNIIANFLSVNNIHVLSITRIDIAIDFINFKNGLYPSTLINRYLAGKYLKNGRGKFTVIGSQKDVRDVEYLRFGTKSSDVNAYLYNKTKEMKAGVWKNYIYSNHKRLRNDKNQDVWRLEFSLKAKATTFLDKKTGEEIKINLTFIHNYAQQRTVLSSLINQYFQFRINDATKNKSRMKQLDLFDLEKAGFTKIYLPVSQDVLKRDKVLMKNIYLINREFYDIDENVENATMTLLRYMRTDEHLNQYFNNKVQFWNQELKR